MMMPAIGFYRVQTDSKRLCDFLISHRLFTHGFNLLLLFLCHQIPPFVVSHITSMKGRSPVVSP